MERKRRYWTWILATLIGTPVLYFASFMPIFWANNRHYLPDVIWFRVRPIYLAPATFVYDHSPEPVRKVTKAYFHWAVNLGFRPDGT